MDNPGEGYAFTILTSRGASLLTSREPPAGARNLMDRSSFKLGDLNWQLQVGADPRDTPAAAVEASRSASAGRPAGHRSPAAHRAAGPDDLVARPPGGKSSPQSRARDSDRRNLGVGRADRCGDPRSATLWRHLGYGPTECPAELDSWIVSHLPRRSRRSASGDRAAHLGRARPNSFEAEYRIRDGLGGWHWVIDRGRVVERTASVARRSGCWASAPT